VTSFTRDCIRWEYRNFNMMANRSSPGTVNDAVNTIHIRHADAGRDMALGDIAEWGGANWATTRFQSLCDGWQTVVVATRAENKSRLRYQSRRTLVFSLPNVFPMQSYLYHASTHQYTSASA